nr:endogenous retrovirus group K member 113 Gag polyprotein-like [Dasypus novemcinctus]
MGGHLSSRQAPQVRALAGLLNTNHMNVSVKQLQTYWDLLLPFNPWLSTCQLWDPDTYTNLIDHVTAAMEYENKCFPPSLLPTLIAIRLCLQGTPVNRDAFHCTCGKSKGEGSQSDSDSDTESLSSCLNNALDSCPPKPDACTSPQDGELPPSSWEDKGKSLPLYPPPPATAPSWPPPEEERPPSYKPPTPWGSPPSCEAPPSWDEPRSRPTPWAPPATDPSSTRGPMGTWPPRAEAPAHQTLLLYPLNAAPSRHRPQDWYLFIADEIKNLCKAVKEDGLGSPYTQHLLEELSTQLAVPYDWVSLARAILTPGQFIDWRAHFTSEAEKQVAHNARVGARHPPDAYTGTGQFANPAQYHNAPPEFWLQLRELALHAFRSCSATRPEPLAKLVQ